MQSLTPELIQRIADYAQRLQLRSVCRQWRDELVFGGTAARPRYVRISLSAANDELLRVALLDHFTHTVFVLDAESPHYQAVSARIVGGGNMVQDEATIASIGPVTGAWPPAQSLADIARGWCAMPLLPADFVVGHFSHLFTRVDRSKHVDTSNALAIHLLSHPRATQKHQVAALTLGIVYSTQAPSAADASLYATLLFRLAIATPYETERGSLRGHILSKLQQQPPYTDAALQSLWREAGALVEACVSGATPRRLRELSRLCYYAPWLLPAEERLRCIPPLLPYMSSTDAPLASEAVNALVCLVGKGGPDATTVATTIASFPGVATQLGEYVRRVRDDHGVELALALLSTRTLPHAEELLACVTAALEEESADELLPMVTALACLDWTPIGAVVRVRAIDATLAVLKRKHPVADQVSNSYSKSPPLSATFATPWA